MSPQDALLAALREHDPDAWDGVYRGVYPRLLTFARRRTATDQQAEDAVSETMLRAMDRIDAYRPGPVGLTGWLFGICRNVVRESTRAETRHRPTESERLGHLVGGTVEDASTAVLDREQCTEVAQAFARLQPADRELLEMRVVLGLGADEVAAVTGRKAGAVRTAQSRALARLRSHMEGPQR